MKNDITSEKHHLTEDEKRKIAKNKAPSEEVKKETKKVISKHLNAIKKLADK